MKELKIKYIVADQIREFGNIEELSRKCEISSSVIHNFMSDRQNISLHSFMLLCEGLDLEVVVRRRCSIYE